MVNGLVEPLQTGMYAVSIQQLARQIGLPEELVELRHQVRSNNYQNSSDP